MTKTFRDPEAQEENPMVEAQKQPHPFFVDAKRYENAKTALTGAEIKAIAKVEPNYQLFLEEEGDKPDKGISDGESVNIAERVKHFFAVPPATFGNS